MRSTTWHHELVKACSQDPRREVVETLGRSTDESEATRLFGVSYPPSSVTRGEWRRKIASPVKVSGKHPKIVERARKLLEADLKERPMSWLSGLGIVQASGACHDRGCFEAYVERVLSPTLRPSQVAVHIRYHWRTITDLVKQTSGGLAPLITPPVEEAWGR